MKRKLLFVAIAWVFGAAQIPAKSELETLRNRCAEQERQIRQLEDENAKLRSLASLSASRNSEQPSLPGPPAPAATPAKTTAKSSSTYTVRPNDSLERVSRKLGITPTALAAMNGLKATSTIREGQKLKIPGSLATVSGTPSAAAPAVAAAPPTAVVAVPASKTHQVKDGETFSSIGRKYGISTTTLIEANPAIKPSAMRPGQTIRLSKPSQTAASGTAEDKPAAPAPPAAAEPAAVPAKTPAAGLVTTHQAAPAAEQAASAAASPAKPPAAKPAPTPPVPANKAGAAATSGSTAAAKPNIRSVTIEGTTTYGEFAAKHGTTIGRLNDLNALDLVETTVLAKGSELYIPFQP